MAYEFFLPDKLLPRGFKYPDSYIAYVKDDLPDFDPWHFFYDNLFFRYNGLQKRYPARIIVPFARRADNDDVACFEASGKFNNPTVAIIHDFASPGWECRGELRDFNAWAELAREESDEYKRFMSEGQEMYYPDISKTLSHALRHDPWLYELELDDEGWVELEKITHLLGVVRLGWSFITKEDLQDLINKSEKKRFEIKNGKIRALYGHSTPNKLMKELSEPPSILYHGTSPRHVSAIKENGLLAMNRQYVHLSLDNETAYEVGKRKNPKPVVLNIDAKTAYKKGIKFYRGNEKVWLADYIPAKYIMYI